MEKEILRVINKMEEMKWITVSPHLNREAIAGVFTQELLSKMTVKNFIEIFHPQ